MTQFIVNGLISGSTYAIVAMGFALIYNTTRIFHFAHGAVYTFGAYIFYTFGRVFGFPFPVAVAFSALLTGTLGLLIDAGMYYPLVRRKSPLLTQLLSSIGLYSVIVNVIAIVFGSDPKTLDVSLQPTYRLGSIVLTQIQLITLLVFVILFVLLVTTLYLTRLGRTVRAMRDDPELLTVMGVDQLKTRRIIFFVGSLFAAIAAILTGLDVGIDPYAGIGVFLNAAVALIIGGVGNFKGVAFGALGLGLLQSLVVSQTSTRWQEPVTFVVLILFLLWRPHGLFAPHRRVEAVGL
jgi:branched-chain amino acid transport system permease protein